MKMNRFKPLAFVAGLAALLAVPSQGALQYANSTTTSTWDAGVSALWGNAPGGPYNILWTSGNTAVFEGTAGTVTISGTVTAGGLTFNTSGYLVTGGTLTLSGTPPITTPPGNSATISSVIAGSGITPLIQGGGNLTLNAVNTLTGGINIGTADNFNNVTFSTVGKVVPSPGTSLNVGVSFKSNSLTVAAGCIVNYKAGVAVGQNASGVSNNMVVTGIGAQVQVDNNGGSQFNLGQAGALTNRVEVRQGGRLYTQKFVIGRQGSDNTALITGSDLISGVPSNSVVDIGNNNQGALNVGTDTGASRNGIIVENGGWLHFNGGANNKKGGSIGDTTGNSDNYILVRGTNSLFRFRNSSVGTPFCLGAYNGRDGANYTGFPTDAPLANSNHLDIVEGATFIAIFNSVYLMGTNSWFTLGNGGADVSTANIGAANPTSFGGTNYAGGVVLFKPDARFNINNGRLISGTNNLALVAGGASGQSLTNNGSLVSGPGKAVLNGPAYIYTTNDLSIISSEITGSGSLTKEGTGKLLLTVSNSYSGLTTISNGTLQAAVTNSLGTGALNIITGAKLEVPAGVIVTAAALSYDGVVQSPGTYGATGSGAAVINNTYFAGTGILNVLGGTVLPLRITSITYDANNDQLTLKWDSSPGATYTIENTQVFVGAGAGTSWDNLTTGIASGGITTTRVIDAPAPGTFYRIRKE